MINNNEHTLIKSTILHLLPGLLVGLFYFSTVSWVKANGFPSIMALIMAGIFVLIPFEVGFLIIQKRKTGEKLKNGIIKYFKPLPIWQYIVWVLIIIILSGILFTLLKSTSNYMLQFFSWIPADKIPDMGLNFQFTKHKLLITYGLFLIFMVIVLPSIEEFYFRGYLLPRIPAKLKNWSVLLHSVLFALYHTWTPWMAITRTIGILPLIYIVKKKENIYLGIIAHCLLNSVDFITSMFFLLNS